MLNWLATSERLAVALPPALNDGALQSKITENIMTLSSNHSKVTISYLNWLKTICSRKKNDNTARHLKSTEPNRESTLRF